MSYRVVAEAYRDLEHRVRRGDTQMCQRSGEERGGGLAHHLCFNVGRLVGPETNTPLSSCMPSLARQYISRRIATNVAPPLEVAKPG